MNRIYLVLLVFVLSFSVNDVEKQTRRINWEINKAINGQQQVMFFKDCEYLDHESLLPYYVESIPLQGKSFRVVLEDKTFEEVENPGEFSGKEKIPEKFFFETSVATSGSKKMLYVKILPLRREGGKLYKLTGFGLTFIPQDNLKNARSSINWGTESVLKSGKWVKIKTSKKGIYRVPYDKLQEWGFSSPQNVNIYGNGGYALPEDNAKIEHDGLSQVSVWKGKDGNGKDCLFFYSSGTRKWIWDESAGQFHHVNNIYSNSAYYFLTEDVGAEKPVTTYPQNSSVVTHTTNSFDEYIVHEKEEFNLIHSGKQWFGEKFFSGMSQTITINCKDKVTNKPVILKFRGAARSSKPSTLDITINGGSKEPLSFRTVNKNSLTSNYADEDAIQITDNADGGSLGIVLNYNASNSSAEAWLDYIEVNYRKQLRYTAPEMYFRDAGTVAPSNIVEYTIENTSPGLKVFDVTGITDIFEVPTSASGNNLSFVRPAGDLREYVVFDPAGDFSEPEKVGDVANQNLHAIPSPDFLIITHPDFINSANELATFHRAVDGMSVSVVKTGEVYNEFSSGMPDATGIRNFIKMFYDRSSKLKYILLFGDGSYDNRNILGTSKNFIPTFQSENSLRPTSSFVTDDYYVMLDANESVYNGAIDLGIGRIPASTTYEAQTVVNKIKDYYSPESFGIWRNTICFIGDDEDSNVHMAQSEEMANQVNASHGAFITDKIYFDAYVQESTTAGERYPGVTDAINERVKNGVLILNYVGHANERFLADEHVLDISNINSWSNSNNLPIFVTATCEFSRFDADETSAGEYILLNPNGGGIGLFSTTRVVWSIPNYVLNKNFYNSVFEKDVDGEHYRMGEIMKLAKIATVNTINKRSFTLLADPALKLSYPRYNVVTTGINQGDAHGSADTLRALSKVTVSGYVADFLGNKLSNFNGKITPVVFDKALMLETLGNAGETPMKFKVQDNVIYKGLASVTDGEFTFSFVVPKDIAYKLGEGRIIYYADNGVDDAQGAFKNFLIGGSSDNQINDNMGPQVELYMDDTSFRSGDKTSKNPLMLAFITDESGVNTVGAGIGHDITAILDGDYANQIVLNDYYQGDIDNYRSGKIEYPLSNLSIGEHSLIIKVWDVANNSSEAEVRFVVSGEFQIESVSNYPNPVKDYTFFTFRHNQPDATFKSVIEIFDQSGRLVDSFYENISSSGMESNPLRWDVNNTDMPLRGGIYLYRITIKASDGAIASKTGKMVVIR
ncbi:FIG00650697: hypothetical protein [hydrothermal vent metagenome]|uniref:Gingipain domain-containing protein n=1 Tax=hydrothermal vent metagenome TaxID=652676 RepID=A0A3B0TYZ7_9ZZZZ